MNILRDNYVVKVLDLLSNLSQLDSDLYGWFNYAGHTDQLDIRVHRFPDQTIPALINYTFYDISKDPSIVVSTIPELEAILESEKTRIEKLVLLRQLHEELGV